MTYCLSREVWVWSVQGYSLLTPRVGGLWDNEQWSYNTQKKEYPAKPFNSNHESESFFCYNNIYTTI